MEVRVTLLRLDMVLKFIQTATTLLYSAFMLFHGLKEHSERRKYLGLDYFLCSKIRTLPWSLWRSASVPTSRMTFRSIDGATDWREVKHSHPKHYSSLDSRTKIRKTSVYRSMAGWMTIYSSIDAWLVYKTSTTLLNFSIVSNAASYP